MSIERLEGFYKSYIKELIDEGYSFADSYIFNFMRECIFVLKTIQEEIDKNKPLTEKELAKEKIGGTD